MVSKSLKELLTSILHTTNIGEVKMYAGSTAPKGWLICDGASISRTKYAKLFSVIGTAYGSGDGSTTFSIPNMGGRTAIGVGTGYSIGSTGGSTTHHHSTGNHTLTVNQIPSHTHGIAQRGGSGVQFSGWHYEFTVNNSNGPVWNQNTNVNRNSSAIGYTGGGQAHNHGNTGDGSNMQPYLTLNYIIYTGV